MKYRVELHKVRKQHVWKVYLAGTGNPEMARFHSSNLLRHAFRLPEGFSIYQDFTVNTAFADGDIKEHGRVNR